MLDMSVAHIITTTPNSAICSSGDPVSNGVVMGAGDAYAAEPETDHTEFPEAGAVIVSDFQAPK